MRSDYDTSRLVTLNCALEPPPDPPLSFMSPALCFSFQHPSFTASLPSIQQQQVSHRGLGKTLVGLSKRLHSSAIFAQVKMSNANDKSCHPRTVKHTEFVSNLNTAPRKLAKPTGRGQTLELVLGLKLKSFV
ncbi:hypothetical protein ElyMa_000259400 [Elysia marginata]|uniref:Uncharacterized protein n=1 Tax=Elysia marginata TaxID=1093978 RepID=A0AAV4F4Z5_9GAST|nr:hypothetical protein ElyMa_000259400 [Elysia marginata]